jgi:hypothetical protein
MARRTRALALPAPTATLALALSILCALLLSGSLPSASAKHSPKKDVAEAPAAPAATAVPVAEPSPSTTPAVKSPKRRGQGRGPNAPAGPGSGQAAGGETSAAGAAKPGRDAKTRAAGSRAAERRARKSAEKSSGQTPSEAGQTSAGGVAQAQAQPSAKSRRERERERRRRERRGEKEGPRESRKEREAREAREHEEAARPLAPQPVATAAAVGSAPAVTALPAQTAVSPLPKIVSEHASRSTGARRAARVRSGTRVLHGAVAPLPGALAAALPAPSQAKSPQRHVASHKPAKRTGAGAQLVRTVTRIIGVVPLLLWLLVGVLGLLAAAFATSSRMAARRARALARQRQALLEDVGLMQAALLPELPDRLGPVATTAAYRPAAGPAAGGDFYDVFGLSDGQLAVIVGDVSGHGREALPHTTLLRFTLRAYMEAGLAPRESLRAAAPILERQLGGSFATVVLAVYNPRARTLTYSCAGHPHPLLTGLSADTPITACSAPPIGADRTTGTRQTVVSIPGAAVVCFYTDGVIEARVDEVLFGVERLASSLEAISETATAASLLDRVSAEADRRPDDMAACLLRIEGGSESPAILAEELEIDDAELSRRRVRHFLAAAGLGEPEIEQTLASARRITGAQGSALLKLRLGDGPPEVSVTHDNVAPLQARSIARSQEVAR